MLLLLLKDFYPSNEEELEKAREEFNNLNFEVHKMEEMLKPMLDELENKKMKRDTFAVIFNPNIVISEVNTPSMGHSYLGKIRIPSNSVYNNTDKPRFLNFSLGKVNKYSGKDDPSLIKLSKEKANDVIKRKIFNFSS